MYINEDTIIAISTAIGKSAIGIIRISGNNVKNISNIFFKKKININRKAEYSKFIDPNTNEVIDNGILIYFKKPNSFTGEDVLEFQCHGNPIILNYIIDCIINNKFARLASNGEFTRRAFTNNKIDLIQSESILNLINSENILLSKLSIKSLNGTLTNKINNINNLLLKLKILINSIIDFSYEDNFIFNNNINDLFNNIKNNLIKLRKNAILSFNLKNEYKISICGKPNVGKSSLFNLFISKDRSIVTNIPGTTRDVLIDKFYIQNNILIKLFDTAGIRKTQNIIENIGIKYSKKYIKNSDIIIFIFDNEINIDQLINKNDFILYIKNYINDNYLFLFIKNNLNKIIFIRNKLDLLNYKNDNIIKILDNEHKLFNISVKYNIGIKNILECIKEKIDINNNDIKNLEFLSSKRHIIILNKIKFILDKYSNIDNNIDLSIFYEDINIIIDELSNISGKNISNEKLLNEIFSKFCIGK